MQRRPHALMHLHEPAKYKITAGEKAIHYMHMKTKDSCDLKQGEFQFIRPHATESKYPQK